MIKEVFKHLRQNGYEPKLLSGSIKECEPDVVDYGADWEPYEGSAYIECPYSGRLLQDDKMREWVAKGQISWYTDLSENNFHVVVSVYVPNKPICYGAELSITITHKDGSLDYDGKILVRKASRIECVRAVCVDLAEKIQDMHDKCVDFSECPGHPFFEVFDGEDRTLYKYNIYGCC